jgi:hypothetical protein
MMGMKAVLIKCRTVCLYNYVFQFHMHLILRKRETILKFTEVPDDVLETACR